jgi:ParB family transcriptional regulator, chromosome partitioning protein
MTEKRTIRSGLGRGLSALMADVEQSSGFSEDTQRTTMMLPVESLIPNPNQPRRDFDQAALLELSNSIRQKGVVQPLIVRPTQVMGQYEIVAGERRWRAAQSAELHQVPVLIRDYSDEEVLEIAIIENVQRADLNSIEEALAYRQLMDRFGHTQEKLAATLSRSRSHIANTLRLLSLPEVVQRLLRDGKLSAGHARALITSIDPTGLAAEVVKRGLSVRETERLAKGVTTNGKSRANVGRPGASEKDADTRAIETDLSANLRMIVSIHHNGPDEGGTLSIKYRTLDDLDLLCDVLSKIPRDIKGL